MSLVSGLAIYFVIWWLVLFLVLPFGVRSQHEMSDVTLGTDSGAPHQPWIVRKVIATTSWRVSSLPASTSISACLGCGWKTCSLEPVSRKLPQKERARRCLARGVFGLLFIVSDKDAV
jgi:predicted secreted protein